MRETDLYPPVKALLAAQGYVVKSEIGAADVVALRDGDPPVVVELKLAFSLSLLHQAVARQAVTDAVYVAVAHKPGKSFARALRSNLGLARRLGLGVMVVRPGDGLVTVHCDPVPFRPRKSVVRQGRLLKEFARRQGDPNSGGQVRAGLVTAYRQDALKLAAHLQACGASKGAEVARATGVAQATRMMRDDHYGWFCRIGPGIYDLSTAGAAAVRAASAM